MTKKRSNFILFWILATTVFLLSAFILMIEASGYKFDWRTKTFTRTGLMIIKTTPKNAQVYLNNQLLPSLSPTRIDKLLPYRYLIEIKLDGYRDWQRLTSIEPGQAIEWDKIVLVAKDLKIESPDEGERQLIDNVKSDEELKTIDNEIYLNYEPIPKLVTRLSQNVKSVRLYPDKNHFIYQVGNQIKFAEIDGRGVVDLIGLDSDEPVIMQFIAGGKYLLLKQKDKYLKILLRD